MPSDLESSARDNLARLLEPPVEPADIDLDIDMAAGYGLTSLNKIVFLMSLCEETDVPLTTFTEPDVADMRTLHDVIDAFAPHSTSAA